MALNNALKENLILRKYKGNKLFFLRKKPPLEDFKFFEGWFFDIRTDN